MDVDFKLFVENTCLRDEELAAAWSLVIICFFIRSH